MICKKCSQEFYENGKYCPQCSNKVIKKKFIITITSISIFFILLLFCLNLETVYPDYYITPAMVPGPKPLMISDRPSTSISTFEYVSQNGGIAFEKIAVPDGSVAGKDIRLTYNPSLPDGSRLQAEISGKIYPVRIYDWMLKPVMEYSNSPYYSCFSLFGTSGNEISDLFIRYFTGFRYFATYHQAFNNTLVGLRLVQMDSFTPHLNTFHEVPTINNQLLLGAGEDRNSINVDQKAIKEIQKAVSGYLHSDNKKESYQSYVIVDYPENIRFSVASGKVELTGELFFHFWNMDNNNVVYLKDMSEGFRKNIRIVQKLNSVVYNSVRDVMRYAAFCRYCKLNNSENYKTVCAQVSKINLNPKVVTPNAVDLTSGFQFVNLFMLYFLIIFFISFWVIFTRAGEKPWLTLVPFFNILTSMKIAGIHRAFF